MASQAQIDSAKAEGYSEAEIAQHLLTSPGVDEARAEGYSDEEILTHLGFSPASASWGPGRALATGATLGQYPKLEAGARAVMGQGSYSSELARLEAARRAYGEANPLLGSGLEIAGSIPTTMAGMALVPELAAPVALGRLAPLATRVGTQAARGAVGGIMTTPLSPEASLVDVPGGAAFGAGLGAAFPLVGAAIAPAVAPAIAQAVKAAEGLGVKLRPGQFATSRALAKLDSMLVSPSHTDAQLQDLTQSFAQALGENSIGPNTISNVETRLGQGFDQFAQQARVRATPQLDSKLNYALAQINTSMNKAGRLVAQPGAGIDRPDAQALLNVVTDIRDQISKNNNLIPGKLYRQMTQSGSMLADLSRNANSTVRQLGGEIADELFSAMEAATPQNQVEAFVALKDQYKNLLLVKPIIKAAEVNGVIDPKKLAGLMTGRRQPVGDVAALARASKYLPGLEPSGLSKAPSLGAKVGLGLGLGLGGLGEAYLMEKDPVLAAQAASAGIALYGAKRGAGAALASDWFRNLALGASRVNPLVAGGVGERAETGRGD